MKNASVLNRKNGSLILLFVFFSKQAFPQENKTKMNSLLKKTEFQIEAGYKTFLNDRYIESKDDLYYFQVQKRLYEQKTKHPTYNIGSGIIVNSELRNKKWSLKYGLYYFLKKEIFDREIDSIIKYRNVTIAEPRHIDNIIEYRNTLHNVEVPFLVQMKAKRFSILGGCNFDIVSYQKNYFSYLVIQNKEYFTSEKTVYNLKMPLTLYPTIQVRYDVKINNVELKPYVAFYYALRNFKDLFINGGVSISIIDIININKEKKIDL